MRACFSLCVVIACVACASLALAEGPLENAIDPGPNKSDEPLANEYSLDKAVEFLDAASLTWQKDRKCFTCHTNFAYLYARPSVAGDSPEHTVVRQFLEELVTQRWVEKGPRWDAEVVAAGAALAFNDRATTGKLHATTRAALDKMWTLQRADGGWDWLKCGWPPMESDDHYGATLAALAVGVAPDKYAETAAAKQGMAKLRDYLKKNPAPTLHHQAMLLWANSFQSLVPKDKAEQIQQQLLKLQQPDGGWALASLGDWQRADGKAQDKKTSDGYGTGFIVYVLQRSGVSRDDPAIQRGLKWLKANQRASGRWYTRSLNKDSKHFITHAGTAMAVLALTENADK